MKTRIYSLVAVLGLFAAGTAHSITAKSSDSYWTSAGSQFLVVHAPAETIDSAVTKAGLKLVRTAPLGETEAITSYTVTSNDLWQTVTTFTATEDRPVRVIATGRHGQETIVSFTITTGSQDARPVLDAVAAELQAAGVTQRK